MNNNENRRRQIGWQAADELTHRFEAPGGRTDDNDIVTRHGPSRFHHSMSDAWYGILCNMSLRYTPAIWATMSHQLQPTHCGAMSTRLRIALPRREFTFTVPTRG